MLCCWRGLRGREKRGKKGERERRGVNVEVKLHRNLIHCWLLSLRVERSRCLESLPRSLVRAAIWDDEEEEEEEEEEEVT